MNNFKRQFTEEAFLFSTFVEFNKCWSSGKKSRLVIESMNGVAFVNFSAFLGHPKTMHFAPREKRDPGRKCKKKSERKTQRDNERAARFQEKKRQEREAAVSEASSENLSSPSVPLPPVPSAASSPKVDFIFSEPAPADVSEDSNSSKMTLDGNVTLPSGEKKEALKDDSNSSNHKLNPIDRKTSSQIYQSIPEESKASVRKLSKQRIKTILREFRQDRAATEAKYKGLRADEAVPVLTEELRIRGVPDYLIPIP